MILCNISWEIFLLILTRVHLELILISITKLMPLVQAQTEEVNLIRQGLYDLQATQKNMKQQ